MKIGDIVYQIHNSGKINIDVIVDIIGNCCILRKDVFRTFSSGTLLSDVKKINSLCHKISAFYE